MRIDQNTHVRASLRGLDSPDAWIIPNNYELRIMHYELSSDHNGLPLQSKFNSSDVFPNNYALRIMNYELSGAHKGSPYKCISQQL